MLNINVDRIKRLGKTEKEIFKDLIDIYNRHYAANKKKNEYYEGKISLNSVNLGIALPENISGLEIGCAWGAKTVDVLAARSMFDGFVGTNGKEIEELNGIVTGNMLISEYMKACRDELKYGCTFATLSADPVLKCRIRFHSPYTAAARWNGEKGRIDCGFAIIDSKKDNYDFDWIPTHINLYLDDAVWEIIKQSNDDYIAVRHSHNMGRPLMEPLVWNATSNKPFGRSRIKEPIRRLIQGYVRTIANATIGLEFSTSPQKYLLGITDEQYDAVVNQKFKQYIGSIIASTLNPETGEKPTFGQLTQGTISPHVEMLRILSTQFSAASGLTVTDVGVVNDANPTSSDAILAQSQTLIGMAEQLNAGNGNALRMIALMAIAIVNNKSLDKLSDDQKQLIAHFKNPAMPSVAVTADAAIKIASAREGFASTDVFLEMIGFDQADIRRIKAQERQSQGMQLISQLLSQPENEPKQGEDQEEASEEEEEIE